VTPLAAYVRAMPKVELHVHMEGAVRPETLLTLAERNRIALPCATVEGVRALHRYRNFKDFARVLLLTVQCLRRPEDFALVIHRFGAEMADHNIRYAEITWTPQFYLRGAGSLASVFDAINRGRRQARADWGVEMRWIPDLVRSVPAPAAAVQRWAVAPAARRGGVVALGLGGPEEGHPAEAFAGIFERARRAGVPANPHAGESEGAESVWGALRALRAARIGHGVRAVEDADLVRHLAERRVPLEVCPTSNLRLGVCPSYGKHPLKRLVEAGCLVTLNSDDPALFDTTLSDEYRHAVEDCGLTVRQLEHIALDAIRASYMPAPRKAAMLKEFEAEYARLRIAHDIDDAAAGQDA